MFIALLKNAQGENKPPARCNNTSDVNGGWHNGVAIPEDYATIKRYTHDRATIF